LGILQIRNFESQNRSQGNQDVLLRHRLLQAGIAGGLTVANSVISRGDSPSARLSDSILVGMMAIIFAEMSFGDKTDKNGKSTIPAIKRHEADKLVERAPRILKIDRR
jgi:hypothetical protein